MERPDDPLFRSGLSTAATRDELDAVRDFMAHTQRTEGAGGAGQNTPHSHASASAQLRHIQMITQGLRTTIRCLLRHDTEYTENERTAGVEHTDAQTARRSHEPPNRNKSRHTDMHKRLQIQMAR
jgi:hypothetical protein